MHRRMRRGEAMRDDRASERSASEGRPMRVDYISSQIGSSPSCPCRVGSGTRRKRRRLNSRETASAGRKRRSKSFTITGTTEGHWTPRIMPDNTAESYRSSQ